MWCWNVTIMLGTYFPNEWITIGPRVEYAGSGGEGVGQVIESPLTRIGTIQKRISNSNIRIGTRGVIPTFNDIWACGSTIDDNTIVIQKGNIDMVLYLLDCLLRELIQVSNVVKCVFPL